MKNSERVFALTRLGVGVSHDEVLRARISNQALSCVEIAEFPGDRRIARFELFDLPIHRDGLEPEFLFAKMFGDTLETLYGFFFFTCPRVKISQHVESGKVIRIILDDLSVLFYGSGNLPLGEEFLSGLYDLTFFESHKGYYVSLNTGAESNVGTACRTRGIRCHCLMGLSFTRRSASGYANMHKI